MYNKIPPIVQSQINDSKQLIEKIGPIPGEYIVVFKEYQERDAREKAVNNLLAQTALEAVSQTLLKHNIKEQDVLSRYGHALRGFVARINYLGASPRGSLFYKNELFFYLLSMKKKLISGLNHQLGTIYCIGRNYTEHAKELNNPVPSSPLIFLKPQSSLCSDGTEIIIPQQSSDVHHEVEIVIAISKKGKNIPKDDTINYIGGIGVGIDFTARDIQQKAKDAGHPWSVAKGFDTFAPVSQFVPINEFDDLDNIDIELSVNEIKRQSGNSSQMIFSISFLISYLSEIFTLYPGDLIFTGTPNGVAQVKSGDQITATLGNQLATLSVSVK